MIMGNDERQVKKNKKRGKAKLERNRGQLAMKRDNMDQVAWARKNDPLYGVKGIERHLRMRG